MGKAVEAEEQPSPVEGLPDAATLISLEQLEGLDAAESAAERIERLQSALGVQHYCVNPRTSVWVDFCFGVLNFARDDAHLQPEKVLSLLTLAHDVYIFGTSADRADSSTAELVPSSSKESVERQERAATKTEVPMPALEASADSYPSVEAVYGRFRDKIRQASGVMTDNSQEPSAAPCAPPFSPTEVARIVSFFTSTFFRHLRAYQYVDRMPRPSVVVERPLPTETPLPPAALADATLQSD